LKDLFRNLPIYAPSYPRVQEEVSDHNMSDLLNFDNEIDVDIVAPELDPIVTSLPNDIEMSSIVITVSNNQEPSDSNVASLSNDIEMDSRAAAVSNIQEEPPYSIIASTSNDIEPISSPVKISNNEEMSDAVEYSRNVVELNSNIEYRSIVDMDLDIEKEESAGRHTPLSLIGEEAILQYLSSIPQSDISDQHILDLALQLEKWSVTEPVDDPSTTTTPTPEMGPITGINPISPQNPTAATTIPIPEMGPITGINPISLQHPAASVISIGSSSRASSQDAASNSSASQVTNSSQSSVESDEIKLLREQLQKANDRAATAETNLEKEKRKNSKKALRKCLNKRTKLLGDIRTKVFNAIVRTKTEQEFRDKEGREGDVGAYIKLSAEIIVKSRNEVKNLRAENAALKLSLKRSANDPVEEPAQESGEEPAEPSTEDTVNASVTESGEKPGTAEQQPANDLPADPEGVDPGPVNSGPVDPLPADRGISHMNKYLTPRFRQFQPCPFKTVLRPLPPAGKNTNMEGQQNAPLPNLNVATTHVPLATFNNDASRNSVAGVRSPTLCGVVATLAISFIIPLTVSFFL
jgi:hypothetical protein